MPEVECPACHSWETVVLEGKAFDQPDECSKCGKLFRVRRTNAGRYRAFPLKMEGEVVTLWRALPGIDGRVVMLSDSFVKRAVRYVCLHPSAVIGNRKRVDIKVCPAFESPEDAINALCEELVEDTKKYRERLEASQRHLLTALEMLKEKPWENQPK